MSIFTSMLAQAERLVQDVARKFHCARLGHQYKRHQQIAFCNLCGKTLIGRAAQSVLKSVELTDDEIVNTFAIGEKGFDIPQHVVFPTEVAYSNQIIDIGVAFSEQMSYMMLRIDWQTVDAHSAINLTRLRAEHVYPVELPDSNEAIEIALRQAARNLAVRRQCCIICANHGWHGAKFVKLFTTHVFHYCARMIMLPHAFEPNRQCSGLTCEICGENKESHAEAIK